ncbi:MAG: NTP transferase domain-containing protein [Pyrodictiaceae archaeon]
MGLIVLAAGLGTRVSSISGNVPKFLLRVEGRPLLYYPIAVASSIGISDVCVIAPKGWSSQALAIARDLVGPGADAVENPYPERENGFSLYLGLSCMGWYGDFLVSMTDHLYTGFMLIRISHSLRSGSYSYIVGGDRWAEYVDHDEATRISVWDPMTISRCGKNVDPYIYIDVGVQAVRAEKLELILGRGEEAWSKPLSEVVNSVAVLGEAGVADVTGLLWTEIDTPRDFEEVSRGRRRRVLEKVLEWLRS